ncbi:MAG TPA: hypothetical protein DDX92_01425 [Flavobacteriales bacterium]|jgi:hypothetical protein|nr:hypothetical protein [Flavobacteriales bacterium]
MDKRKNLGRNFIFAGATILFLMGVSPHPHHASVTEIRLNTDRDVLEISLKFFSHDLEKALKKLDGTVLKLGSESLNSDDEETVNQYVLKSLTFIVDGSLIDLKKVGIESKPDDTHCYYEYEIPDEVNSVIVQNNFLFETFKDQQNIIHFYRDDQKIQSIVFAEKGDQFTIPVKNRKE